MGLRLRKVPLILRRVEHRGGAAFDERDASAVPRSLPRHARRSPGGPSRARRATTPNGESLPRCSEQRCPASRTCGRSAPSQTISRRDRRAWEQSGSRTWERSTQVVTRGVDRPEPPPSATNAALTIVASRMSWKGGRGARGAKLTFSTKCASCRLGHESASLPAQCWRRSITNPCRREAVICRSQVRESTCKNPSAIRVKK